MSSSEIIRPCRVKLWQFPARLSICGLPSQRSELLKVLLEIREHHQEPCPIAFDRDPVFLPLLLLGERWQGSLSGQDARCGNGLPFEDFER
jgi:hypothetical protein